MGELKVPYAEFKGRALPMMKVAIKGDFWQDIQAFVDSGASFRCVTRW